MVRIKCATRHSMAYCPMSLPSQEQFKNKVINTLIQDDQATASSNMRRAIDDTNVVLNMAITPEVILIPYNMIILTKKILRNQLQVLGTT